MTRNNTTEIKTKEEKDKKERATLGHTFVMGYHGVYDSTIDSVAGNENQNSGIP